jgi:hypothetical protein
MPWRVRKKPVKGSKNWAIQKKEGNSWKIVGRSTSKQKAQASVRARRASE